MLSNGFSPTVLKSANKRIRNIIYIYCEGQWDIISYRYRICCMLFLTINIYRLINFYHIITNCIEIWFFLYPSLSPSLSCFNRIFNVFYCHQVKYQFYYKIQLQNQAVWIFWYYSNEKEKHAKILFATEQQKKLKIKISTLTGFYFFLSNGSVNKQNCPVMGSTKN